MLKKKTKVMVGNWKMNPLTDKEAKDLASKIKRSTEGTTVKVVVCPPILFLADVGKVIQKTKIALGAQDMFWEGRGAYTGQISGEMIKKAGASYCIIGHSEKREGGDTDEMISKKVQAALKLSLKVVLCIGEKERDVQGTYLAHLKEQLSSAFKGINRTHADQILIAYEPIWAIGTGNQAMTSHDLHQMVLFIHKHLIDLFGPAKASIIPILYGGSVDPENTSALVREGEVDGLLVGRNSLDAQAFGQIIKAVAK
jgi:triosephosphate isomerase